MNNYYIYIHWDNDEAVYIGMGSSYRAWMSDNRRTPEHREWIKSKLPFLNAEIWAANLTKEEAYHTEKIMISAFKPKYNLAIPNQIDANGQIFYSPYHAAKYFNMPITTVKGRAEKQRMGWSYVTN